jgi:hypothetical protein
MLFVAISTCIALHSGQKRVLLLELDALPDLIDVVSLNLK